MISMHMQDGVHVQDVVSSCLMLTMQHVVCGVVVRMAMTCHMPLSSYMCKGWQHTIGSLSGRW